jgi:hypothetical protein
MTDNSKKLSELATASNAASTDRLLILRDPAGTPSTRTIGVANLVASMSYANTTVAGTVKVGNNLSVNATGYLNSNSSVANLTITSNTLNLGTSTISANGYTYLPNGVKINWGKLVCNTVSQITFSNAFSTALLSITVTPASSIYVGANTPYVFASNTTTANVYSVSTTTTNNVYYVAIGY